MVSHGIECSQKGNHITRLRTGPVLRFGLAGFLLTQTGAGPFLDRRRSIF